MESIEFLSAILIYTRNVERLVAFYRDALGMPVEKEEHGAGPVHYGCELGDVHFAIHPGGEELSASTREQRVRLAFAVFSTAELLERLGRHGVSPLHPSKNASFAVFTAVHDPDGNYIEFTELRDDWYRHLKSRKETRRDIVMRWEERRRE